MSMLASRGTLQTRHLAFDPTASPIHIHDKCSRMSRLCRSSRDTETFLCSTRSVASQNPMMLLLHPVKVGSPLVGGQQQNLWADKFCSVPRLLSLRSISDQASTNEGTGDDGEGLWAEGDTFEKMGLDDKIMDSIRNMGLSRPTRIQAAGAGPISEGKDVVLGAETGSGKTLAYLLPVLQKLFNTVREDRRPEALVLVPNQELAMQVMRVVTRLGFDEEMSPVLIAGAQGYQQGADCRLIVATPSGILRHTTPFLLEKVMTCVVDEADMLLDGGFFDDVEKILAEIKPQISLSMRRRYEKGDEKALELRRPPAQLVFAAATLPDWKGDKVRSVVRWMKKKYPDITFVQTEDLHKASIRATQEWVEVDFEDDQTRMDAVSSALKQRPDQRTMVFVNTVAMAKSAVQYLQSQGHKVAVLHKEMSSVERSDSMASFRSGLMNIMICTDLGSRGLDIQNVEHVIQAQLAENAVAHIHRIGRTARAGAQGHVTNIWDQSSAAMAAAIQSEGGQALAPVFSRNRGFNRRLKRNSTGKAELE